MKPFDFSLPYWKAQGLVYAVRPVRSKMVKIGFTRNIDSRARQLARGERAPVDVLAVFQGPRRLERELHVLFSERHVHTEWFALSTSDVEFLSTLPSVRSVPYRITTDLRLERWKAEGRPNRCLLRYGT